MLERASISLKFIQKIHCIYFVKKKQIRKVVCFETLFSGEPLIIEERFQVIYYFVKKSKFAEWFNQSMLEREPLYLSSSFKIIFVCIVKKQIRKVETDANNLVVWRATNYRREVSK